MVSATTNIWSELLLTCSDLAGSHCRQTTEADAATHQQYDGRQQYNRRWALRFSGPEVGKDHRDDGTNQVTEITAGDGTAKQNPTVSDAAA